MRTFEEILADIDHAASINDADVLLRYAAELDGIGTRAAEASSHTTRGSALFLRGDYSTSMEHYNCALKLYEVLEDRISIARVMANVGILHSHTGDQTAALDQFHRALAIFEDLGDRKGVATVTGSIGIVHGSIGDNPAALEHFHRTLALEEELGNRNGAAGAMCNIGIILERTGDYPAALEHYHRALALCEELGNRRFAANISTSIGNIYFDIGNHTAALQHYHSALALYEELESRSGVALVMGNIGSAHSSVGDHIAALEHFHRALAIHEELGERSGVVAVTSRILGEYVNMGSDAEAEALLQAIDIMQIDEPRVRINREHQRATLQERSGDLDSAAVTLQRALAEAQEHGLRSNAAGVHRELRDLALKRNNLAAYVEHNNEYTRITEEINGKEKATKLAMQAKQREIDAKDRETQKQLAVLHSTLPKEVAERVARGEATITSRMQR